MKPFIAGIALALFVGFMAADEPKGEWVKAADKDLKFESQFPAKPIEKSGPGSKQLLLERDNGKAALLVLVTDIPTKVDITNAAGVKAILDGGRTGTVNSFKGGKLLTEKDFKFGDKYPARDIDIEHPTLGIYRVRMILTPTRLYQVVVLAQEGYQKGEEAKKFIDSFKLTD